ncbi:hypothetical protein BGZ61DRAFT_190428 [Ilyonectria robusta]|uniref:uncharacterized protein n=1 Tax=Ilyonectria robusta TaxID=1079257 RepID=UPI001E8E7A26|nr:uncharacterized protein BGZ61DRAFT_190428 [Ilyonectria robusta]KAH8656401.1 hypothetical protein BGZ61DRAFT_190428 [Ilyonectria robusta]
MTAIVASPTQAAPNMTPDYEVKLLLNPTAVLGPDNELTSTVLLTFDMPPTVTKLNVQFLDKSCKEIYTAGWSPRIRKTENEDDFELTYKKRYVITGGDIDAALTTANNDGFDAGDAKYEAQVEWGYQKQTLSISRKKTAADSGNSGMDLPGTSNSRAMLIDEAPDKFDNWLPSNWGTGALAMSRIFGPVLAKRSIGTWSGMRLSIEVWPILNSSGTGIEYIVEASFKTKSRTTASIKHGSFTTYLQGKGWFLAQDSLKTQLIMERYWKVIGLRDGS